MQPKPMADTSRFPSLRFCMRFFPSVRFFKDFAGNADGGARRRPARVECEMGDYFRDLGACDAIFQRALQMKRQLIDAIERDEGRDCDKAAVAWREAGTFPDITEQDVIGDV